MNLDSLTFALSQISFLVTTLSKKNYKEVSQELTHLTSLHGLECDRHLLRCLFSAVDWSSSVSAGATQASSSSPLTQLLVNECAALLTKPTLVSNLCHAIDNPLQNQKSLKPSPQLFAQLKKVLKLTPVQEVVFGLALVHSTNTDTQNFALQFAKLRLPDLIHSYIDTEGSHAGGGLHETTPEIIHLILTHLLHGPKEQFGITEETKESFLKTLRRDYPRDLVPVVLAPLLYPDITYDWPMDKLHSENTMTGSMLDDSSLADLMVENGYSLCSSVEECRNSLSALGTRELTPATVARILGIMARTHTGLEESIALQTPPISFWNSGEQKEKSADQSTTLSTWNVEIFVQTLKEIVPGLSWSDVIEELDHPKFQIKDRQGLNLLFTSLRLGFHSQGFHQTENFPSHFVYRQWKNIDGQFSLLQQIVKNPDIFCVSDYPHHPVAVDILKSPPESDNKEFTTWRALDLVDAFLCMADRGLYNQVSELFKLPIQICPDVLLLGLLQINSPMTAIRQDLLTTLIPTFLGNHPNSAIILHHAWHSQTMSIKPIIMHSMAEWYARGDSDQTRLSRILDVAQDLKALSMLLNAQSFPFVIDLACLASRREYLKLEKWLTDKIREHGDSFVSACIKFLQRRCPIAAGGGKEDALPKSSQLPHETLSTILLCLQQCVQNSSTELTDSIVNLVANCNMIYKNRQQQQAPPAAIRNPHRPIDGGFNPSSLGGQLYSGPQSDIIANIGSSLAGMSLGGAPGSLGPPSSSAFNLPGSLGQLVSTPGSPSRMMGSMSGSSPSPFPLMPLGTQLLSGPVGTQIGTGLTGGSSLVPGAGVSAIGGLGRMAPQAGAKEVGLGRFTETASLFPDISQNVSKEVEDEANSYFQRIYNHPPHPTLSIDEVLEMLKKFQDSSNKRESEVFNCMLRNLFEEYRFFPQYPDKELHITAQLFGGIIERGLVTSYMALGLALRFVLDALRKPNNSKMYYFGIAALDRFKSRLKDYHKYCEHVATIAHFREFPPHLIQYVEYGLQSQEPPGRPEGQVLPSNLQALIAPAQTAKTVAPATTTPTTTTAAKTPTSATQAIARPSIANATNIDTLLVATEKEEKVLTAPPEALQDKIGFVFNNLSQLNLSTKCDELREIVTEEYWPWMSQYLVMKRASIEFNFHSLYSNFLEVLKFPELNLMVIGESFRNIRVLLRSDKSIANFSDRSLLKNLGHWLGMLTLGRNRPILAIEIDLKSLLAEAYNKGQQELLYVVPFVAKVLESCAKSKAFKPPNPWTMAIMNVLAELHQEPDLKLNLKFEIEVLCKNLNIDVAELKPSIYLKDPETIRNLQYQLSNSTNKIKSIELPSLAVGSSLSQSQQQQQPTQTPLNIEELSSIPISSSSAISPSPVPAVVTTPTSMLAMVGQPEPRFAYMEINVLNTACLAPHVTISNNIGLFQAHPQLKQFVRPAVERAVQEWILPVVDRSIKIALTTCEQIVKKDFALDPEEARMRAAAHHMVRNLTAGMAMITCRDQLLVSIGNNLKQAFLAALMAATQQQKELVEQAANIAASDNMELACAFIQKTAIEKVITEVDKRLINDFELRNQARKEGRRYCDSVVLTYQAERMPEQIRLKVGGVTQPQMAVYEEFARNIPGFQPLSDQDAASFLPKPVAQLEPPPPTPVTPFQQVQGPNQVSYGTDEMGAIFEKLASELEHYLQSLIGSQGVLPNNVQVVSLHNLLEAVVMARRSRDIVSATTLLQKVIEGLLDGLSQMPSDPDFMVRLSAMLETLRLNHDSAVLADRVQVGPTSHIHCGIQQVRARGECDDPPGLLEKTEYLLRDWVNIYHTQPPGRDPTRSFSMFVQQMNGHGILKTDDLITRFFRLSTQLCVDLCYRTLGDASPAQTPHVRSKCFHTLDAFVRLIALLVKHSGDSSNTNTKINLLNKVVGIVTGVLLQDHENRGQEFQQLPYHRIFIMLFLELNSPEPVLDAINFQVLTAFCHTLHILRPTKSPGFAYAWLELVSHRVFIGRMLALTPQQKAWGMYAQLLVDLFRFLAPFLRNAELAKPVTLLYKGTLRVLLVLLHDFPEFLCDYHYGFCDVIPPNCIQMRNLILSAFPRNMRLPDPFTPNLKVDLLPEIIQAPRVLTNFTSMISPVTFKKELDSYLKARAPVTFLSELRSNLQVSNDPGMRYNIQLMNALVLYVGTQAINFIRNKGLTPNMSTIAHSSHMDIFQNLAVDLDTEGRYLFLNAIANQLRYPNSHTHYFSCTLLYLFAEANTEAIQEQITRVLLERLIVNRPHPWGLLITFIELIKNPTYKFWNHEFVHCAPEIEKLFESVARSCMVQKQTAPLTENDISE